MSTTYFFIHTPKCSGTTFIDLLEKAYPGRVGYFYPPLDALHEFESAVKDSPYQHFKTNPDWKKYKFIVGHFTFGIHEVAKTNEFRYVGVFREPVAHCLSSYKAFLRMPEPFKEKFIGGPISLRKYLERSENRNLQTFFLSGLSMEDIRKDENRAFQVAVENVDAFFDAIYPQEKFDQGMIYLKHRLGLKLSAYTARNVAQNMIPEPLDDETNELIRSANSLDLRLYDHLSKRFETEYERIPFGNLKTELYKFRNRIRNRDVHGK